MKYIEGNTPLLVKTLKGGVGYFNSFSSLSVFVCTFQMSTMPGLPTRPCFYDIDLDPVTEDVLGLF